MRPINCITLAVLFLYTAASPEEDYQGFAQFALELLGGGGDADVDVTDGQVTHTLERHLRARSSSQFNSSLSSIRRPTSGRIPLTRQGARYFGQIAIGTPRQKVLVVLDTGSTDFWLIGPSCRAKDCTGHTDIYHPKDSNTSRDLSEGFTTDYNKGTVSGDLLRDVVTLAGVKTSDEQVVGVASAVSPEFNHNRFPPSGILGLAIRSLPGDTQKPVLQTLLDDNKLYQPLFSFKLSVDDTGVSEFTFGAISYEHHDGPIEYFVTTSPYLWEIGVSCFSVNGQQVISYGKAIFDTGNTFILGSKANIEALYNLIPGSEPRPHPNGKIYYWIPCHSVVVLSFTFGTHTFSIPAAAFLYSKVPNKHGNCFAGVASKPRGKTWVLGHMFLRAVYTVYELRSVEGPRVGIARLKAN